MVVMGCWPVPLLPSPAMQAPLCPPIARLQPCKHLHALPLPAVQELIKQGVLEPPKPKVKISNLHRVLGAEAGIDPTMVEREVRRQMAERAQAHMDRNLERKLSPAAVSGRQKWRRGR